MIKSEPILPIRFYDDLFDQQRFNFHCKDNCQFELKYPSNELPFFQFTRNKKYQLPDLFFLRKACTDDLYKYYKDIPEAASNFGGYDSDNFYLPAQPFPRGAIIHLDGHPHGDDYGIPDFLTLNCEKLVPNLANVPPNAIVYSSDLIIPLSDETGYEFKIIVDKFVNNSSTFFIKIYSDDVNLIGVIDHPGIFYFPFVSSANNTPGPQIKLVFENFTNQDYFEISYVQATLTTYITSIFTGDIQLDETLLKVVPMNNGKDIITYCGDYKYYNVPDGLYYYIVLSGNDSYFSETFNIISLKETEKMYRLKWFSTCDINDNILYKSHPCVGDILSYSNQLYLDAGLFKPEYNTKEEGEENGKGDLTVLLQIWEKTLNFEIAKAPEFIADALSGVFLHDKVFLRKPSNFLQEKNNSEFQVKKVTQDVTSVLEDCFQKVNMKLLLFNKYNDTACCVPAEIFDCTPCKYTAGDSCDSGLPYALLLPPSVGIHGLYDCATGGLVSPSPRPTDLICFNGKYYTIELISGNWVVTNIYPKIISVNLAFIFFVVHAGLIPNSFGIIEYNKNGAGWTYLDTIAADNIGDWFYTIPLFLPIGATDFKIRIHNVTLTCDFGYTDIYDVI